MRQGEISKGMTCEMGYKMLYTAKRILSVLLCAAVCCGILMTGCGSEDDGKNYAFSYSLTADPKNLDPQMASDNNSLMVIKNMFEGLMRIGPDGDLIYGVATSYTSNEDDTEFTFYLRKDAAWSDGTPVTAYDFAFAWKRALDPATGSGTCATLYCIKNATAINQGKMDKEQLGVTIIDAYTLKVSLEYSYAEFPLQTTLAQFMPCNQVFFESTAGHYGLNVDYLIANGPFCFDKWNHDNYVRLKRNEKYKGENEVCPRILYLGIRAADTDYFNLLEETVEAAKIESHNVKKLETSDYKTYTYTDKTWGLLFNTEARGFTNVNIRQAFATSIESSVYEPYLKDNTEIAYDIVPPATKLNGTIYREIAGSGFKIAANPAGAHDLLVKGLREIEYTSMPDVTILCLDDEETIKMVQYMLQSWQQYLRIYVNLVPMDEDDLKEAVRLGEYQIAVYQLSPTKDGPLACLQEFASSTYYNPANLNSAAYDSYINAASAKTNTEDILSYLVAAERYLNDYAIFYPLYYETTYYATWDNVEGIYFSPFDGTADFTCAKCYE